MKVKVSMLFSLTTGGGPGQNLQRVGGWSESVYWEGLTIDALKAALFAPAAGGVGGVQPLCPTRASLLPTSAQLVGQRLQQVDPPGPTTSLGNLFPGG